MRPARSRSVGTALISLTLPAVSISTYGRPMTSASVWTDADGPATARAADRLCRVLPFAPNAARCALTYVLSITVLLSPRRYPPGHREVSARSLGATSD